MALRLLTAFIVLLTIFPLCLYSWSLAWIWTAQEAAGEQNEAVLATILGSGIALASVICFRVTCCVNRRVPVGERVRVLRSSRGTEMRR